MEKHQETVKKSDNLNTQEKNKKKSKPLTPEEIKQKEIKDKEEMEKRRADFFGPSLDFSGILPNLLISDGKGNKKKARFSNITEKNKSHKPAKEKKEKKEYTAPQKPAKQNQNMRKPEEKKPFIQEEKKSAVITQQADTKPKSGYHGKKQQIVLQKKVKPKKPTADNSQE